MKDMIRITDYSVDEIQEIFSIADEINSDKYKGILEGKTVVMFFPDNSIRTRVSFEKGIYLLGGQTILFPPETLDKKEALQDVIGYLNNLADLYSLSKIRPDFRKDNFLFCGVNGNIGKAWKEASDVFGFKLEQCCGKGYEIEGITAYEDIAEAVAGKDIVCTDSLPSHAREAFKKCQVTKAIMDKANKGALLNPCPPFYRGEEVAADAIDSEYFVGYEFKKALLEVQQAVIVYCLMQ